MRRRLRVCAPLTYLRRSQLVLALALTACADSTSLVQALSPDCQPGPCHAAAALDASGTCHYTNKKDGTACDDGESCTVYDHCEAGVCVGGSSLPDGTICTDKNVCTQTDTCHSGRCVGSNPLICPPGDACHEGGICDPVSGCQLISYGPCVEGLKGETLSGCTGSGYTAALSIGNQSFNLLVDSGSTTVAVAMGGCKTCGVTPNYTPTSSAAYQNHNVTVRYGDGSGYSAAVWRDNVFAGSGSTAYSPTVSMRVGAIYSDPNSGSASAFFTGGNCSGTANKNAFVGIWGLGPSDLAANYTDTFMDKVAATATLRYDAMAMGLCDMGGTLFLGGFNPNFVSRPPSYSPMVASSPFYAVAIDDALVGTRSVGLNSAAWNNPIIDSGTDFWLLPSSVYAAMTQLILSDPNFSANFTSDLFSSGKCQTSSKNLSPAEVDAQLPQLTLLLPSASQTAGISVTQPATASYLQAIESNNTTYYCGTLVDGGSSSIMGDAILKRQLVVIDRQNAQVGFAPLVGCSQALPAQAVNSGS